MLEWQSTSLPSSTWRHWSLFSGDFFRSSESEPYGRHQGSIQPTRNRVDNETATESLPSLHRFSTKLATKSIPRQPSRLRMWKRAGVKSFTLSTLNLENLDLKFRFQNWIRRIRHWENGGGCSYLAENSLVRASGSTQQVEVDARWVRCWARNLTGRIS